MDTLTGIAELRARLRPWRAAGERIALVPTMGNLHDGHVALMHQARSLCGRVVASIFVNPTQFGPAEDFTSYPRTLEQDQARLAAAGVDLLFAPPVAEIYPSGTAAATRVSVPGLSGILCGASRPGHFDGVAAVCCRLFNIVQPDVAVFGQKDFQQVAVLRRMVADLHLPLQIVTGATVRAADGLALSSRNQYLSAEERARAPAIHRALSACRGRLLAGERDFARLEAAGLAELELAGFAPEYFAIRRMGDLALPGTDDRELVILAAARLGRARLIDNVLV